MIRPDTWYDALHNCQHQGQSYVLVTVMGNAGSTPRNAGAKMLITAESTYDTIGGGHLEHQVTHSARKLLSRQVNQQHIEHYPLSSKLGQCCGGAVNVLYEVMASHSKTLIVFGAGHVSKALIPIIAQLPLQICWIDCREEMFSGTDSFANVTKQHCDDPVSVLKDLATPAMVLIMTHNHQLDFDLVEQALKHDMVNYCGMIGSVTKSKRFRARLEAKGFNSEQINQLICPVGVTEITGKQPIEVAVSIAGQIIQVINPDEAQRKDDSKAAWKQSKQLSKLI